MAYAAAAVRNEVLVTGPDVVSLEALAQMKDPPIVKVVPDKRAPYERVAQVLAAAQRSRVQALSVAPIADSR